MERTSCFRLGENMLEMMSRKCGEDLSGYLISGTHADTNSRKNIVQPFSRETPR